jgi:hypothetical protein
VLLATVLACGQRCSAEVKAQIMMYVGIVRADAQDAPAAARQAFTEALELSPNVELDDALAQAAAKALYEEVRGEMPAQAPPAEPEPVESPPRSEVPAGPAQPAPGSPKQPPGVNEAPARTQVADDEEARGYVRPVVELHAGGGPVWASFGKGGVFGAGLFFRPVAAWAIGGIVDYSIHLPRDTQTDGSNKRVKQTMLALSTRIYPLSESVLDPYFQLGYGTASLNTAPAGSCTSSPEAEAAHMAWGFDAYLTWFLRAGVVVFESIAPYPQCSLDLLASSSAESRHPSGNSGLSVRITATFSLVPRHPEGMFATPNPPHRRPATHVARARRRRE